MPDPRSERPYFKADKLLNDAILIAFSGVDLKIVLAIQRRTIGHYAQEDAEISVSLLQAMTGCDKTAIMRGVRRLITQGVISETRSYTKKRSRRLRLNTDPSAWGAYSEVVMSSTTTRFTLWLRYLLYTLLLSC